ncbi:ImmA/IrrE family metallo-endopeptidase [Rhodococcus sp. NKCM2511]|uniref:ImmA/IrrE family metallo-endopeptidase n=1 Tax=Rhodococcus sp. NKCM2511 TaxID=2766011 RepID=UPI0019108C87|nr:ImmA/IrrE family metallo-endopeptidase [Rhodococcus sp. NKCM2511]
MWRDEARFKNLGTVTEAEQQVLTGFGMAVGRTAISATPGNFWPIPASALELREAILSSSQSVGISELISTCWAIGIPVLSTKIFPLAKKSMHAMSVRLDNRYCIIIGLYSKYPAKISFTVAHELGHIALGHLEESGALFDIVDPTDVDNPDHEEREADRYALQLLTGSERPDFIPQLPEYNGTMLARSLMDHPVPGVDSGVVALCTAFKNQKWKESYSALKMLPRQHSEFDVGDQIINPLAQAQFDLGAIDDDRAEFLATVLGVIQ